MKTPLSLALLILFAVTGFNVLSQAPKTLSYQARLSDSGGPLNGTYTLTFTIYDAATGGSALWTEPNSGVSATNGNISLTLGKLTPININTDQPLWMGIRIGSNAEITPRIELTGSLYSLGLALPYSAKTAAPGNVFLIEATQDGARAGEFIHSGSGGGQAALFATSTGGNRAFQALNSGPAASSALFYMQNTSSFSPNVEMQSQSLGQGLQIEMLNNNNASDAINITHSGSGYAINANRPIKAPTIVVDSMSTTGSIYAARFFGNGSGLTNLPSSLSLPYTGTSSSTLTAFSVNNTATSGGAGNFTISNSASGGTGLTISNQGTGPGLNSFQFGPSGSPGIFQTSNTTNTSPTLRLAQNGLGQGILLTSTNATNSATTMTVFAGGTGTVANFTSNLASNSLPVITITGNGTGNAITANKPIQATKFIGDGSGLTNLPSGLALPYNTVTSTPGNVFRIESTADGARAEFVSSASGGGQAALFAISTGGNIALSAQNSGIASPAGSFYVSNTGSFGAAIEGISNSGVSFNSVMQLTHNGTAGSIATFRSSNANVARIDKAGKGFFNGGTQTGGADVAEMFDVEGASSQYEPGDVLVISEKTDRTVEKSKEANSTRIAGVYATKPGVILTERDIEQNLDDLVPMGVVGVIPTKVCDENGPIKRGDLLVTSAVTGHAMKAIPIEINGMKIYPTGAILGKALENFDGNRGLIKVLVNVK